jgi:hypothetical protein
MNKKIYVILLVCVMIISCGKKGDPVYKEKKSELSNIQFKTI